MELNVNDVHAEILKNFKYIANDLMHNKGNKFSIMNDLNFYFNCKKIIIGHVINTNNLNNETCYFNGLIKSLDIGISKKSIDKFKVYLKNNVYKSENEFYIVVNNKLYNIKQVKQIILNKMLNNENLNYFKNSNDEFFNNGIYFIQDFLNVKKQYEIENNVKQVEIFIQSLKFVYSSLKYLLKVTNNKSDKIIECNIDFITFINYFDYKLDDIRIDDIQRVFNVMNYFKKYKFSNLFKNFDYDSFNSNSDFFIPRINTLITEFFKFQNITPNDIINGNIDYQIFQSSKLEDLINYLDKDKTLDKNILNFKTEFEYQMYNYLTDNYKLNEPDFEKYNLIISNTTIFNYLKDIVKSFIPIISEIKILDNNEQTIKQNIKYNLQYKLRDIENKLNRYKDFYNDLQSGIINSLDYFLKINYINDIGYKIFDYMEITIDEQIIERLGFEYYLIHKQLHSTYEKRKCLNKLINGINGVVYIPLHFFFNDNIELSLPLLKLKNSEINFNIKFKELNQIIENKFITSDLLTYDKFEDFNFKAYMVMKYIIIDQEIVKKIINKSMKLMINQFQYSKPFLINSKSNSIKLNFKNSIKYLVIYLETDKKPLKDIQIYFENFPVSEKIDADYYNLCTKYNSFNVCEYDNLYVINYSLYPESLQPSGSLNYSCFNNIEIYFNFKDTFINESFTIKVYALSYNYLNIDSGKCYLEFES